MSHKQALNETQSARRVAEAQIAKVGMEQYKEDEDGDGDAGLDPRNLLLEQPKLAESPVGDKRTTPNAAAAKQSLVEKSMRDNDRLSEELKQTPRVQQVLGSQPTLTQTPRATITGQ